MYTVEQSCWMPFALDHMRALAQHRVPSDKMNDLENLAYSNWMLAIAKDFPEMPTGKAHVIFWDLVDNIVGKTHDCDYVCQSIEDEGLREALRQYMDKKFRDTRVLDIREFDTATRIAVEDAIRIRDKLRRTPSTVESNCVCCDPLERIERNPEWDALYKKFTAARDALPEKCHLFVNCAVDNLGDCYLPRN